MHRPPPSCSPGVCPDCAGLVCLELYKVLQKLRRWRTTATRFANLAVPLFAMSGAPAAPRYLHMLFQEDKWTLWEPLGLWRADLGQHVHRHHMSKHGSTGTTCSLCIDQSALHALSSKSIT